MTLALHSHHAVICATLAFTVAILLPFWYTAPLNSSYQLNPLNMKLGGDTQWTFTMSSGGSMSLAAILTYIMACISVVGVGIGLFSLLLGSWYVQRSAAGNGSKCLLFLTSICILFSFLLSGGVWAIMLTANKWLPLGIFSNGNISLGDFSYSFWINLGATIGYLYAFLLSLMGFCSNAS